MIEIVFYGRETDTELKKIFIEVTRYVKPATWINSKNKTKVIIKRNEETVELKGKITLKKIKKVLEEMGNKGGENA